MVKLTYPRSTSRGYGTQWDLNSGRGTAFHSEYHGLIRGIFND